MGTLEYWNIGLWDLWNVGIWNMKCWIIGILKYWNIGISEYWNIGTFEYWNIGILEYGILELLEYEILEYWNIWRSFGNHLDVIWRVIWVSFWYHFGVILDTFSGHLESWGLQGHLDKWVFKSIVFYNKSVQGRPYRRDDTLAVCQKPVKNNEIWATASPSDPQSQHTGFIHT